MAFLPAACRRKKTEGEDTSRPAMLLTMSDARAPIQLVHGFYALEAGTWRWTDRVFSVSLRAPPNAAQNGAHLVMRLTVPQTQIDKLGSLTLSAAVNGTSLPPETYSHSGDFLYERDVPATALTQDMAAVNFTLDKVAQAPPPDGRQLGIVVTSVGFMGK